LQAPFRDDVKDETIIVGDQPGIASLIATIGGKTKGGYMGIPNDGFPFSLAPKRNIYKAALNTNQ
jgi:hypothetical protein